MKSTTFILRPDHEADLACPHPFDAESTLVVAFGGPRVAEDSPIVARLVAAFPRSVVIGCSTAGEIFGDAIHDGCLSVAVMAFEKSALRVASAPVHAGHESGAAGEQLAQALAGPRLAAVFMLSDGLSVNGTALVAGINGKLPPGVVVTGGLAGDGERFGKTWVLHEGRLRANVVVAVGLYGEHVRVMHGSRGGWDAFGPPRTVTRSTGNVLSELGGRPALDVYREYLGDLAGGLPATALLFPLALREDQQTLVRTVLSIDDATKSMTFAGDVPEGSEVQLMRANLESLIEGAADAARQVRSSKPAGDGSISIAISCVGRRLVLGERAEEEVESALECLPSGTRLVGFYSYGEISPGDAGAAALHNQTMTITTFAEAA